MTLGKRLYEYEDEQFEVIQTSPDSATVNLKCEECDHDAFIVGTMEGQAGWLIGRKESGEGPRGPIDTFAKAVEWCCYMLLAECRSIDYVDAFFAEDAGTIQGNLDASTPLLACRTTLSMRVYEDEAREFEVVRTSLDSVQVNLICEKHDHLELIVDMSVQGVKEWVISRAGDSHVHFGAFAGDDFSEAIEHCGSMLLEECGASVQADEFFTDDVRTIEESLDVSVPLSTDEDDDKALTTRLYEYKEKLFEAIRTSPDSATVNLKCGKHEHDDLIIGRMDGERGWLIGRKPDVGPRGPIEIFAGAVEYCANMLVEECEAFVQLDEFFAEGLPTVRERLDALVVFLPKFESPDFDFGRMETPPGKMPYYTLSPLASCFVKTCYEMGWVKPFEWADWKDSPEATLLRDDRSALKNATLEHLVRLLTVVIRQERFVEGALGNAFESGLLRGILRRAAVLATDIPDTRPG